MEEIWLNVKFHLMKLAYFKARSRLRRYGFSLILVVAVFTLVIFLPKDYLHIVNNQAVSLLAFIFIVTASSWYGGLGPGIFATLLTDFANYFALLQADLPHHPMYGDLALTLIYTFFGLFISILSEVRYEAEVQKDEFIGFASHELKNPLTVIRGFTGLLSQYSKKLGNHKAVRFTEEIGSQSDRLLELINDLLDVNKIEVGKFAYKTDFFGFDQLVKETIRHQRIINKKRTISLSGSSKSIIEGDRYRIGQVITNLLSNALKYSPHKSPVKVKIKKNKEGIILSIKDYGVGIPKSEQGLIFNQYYRARSTLRGKTEGLGLGLFICKSIINRHRGKIWVKSTKGKGSTFSFLLPIKQP